MAKNNMINQIIPKHYYVIKCFRYLEDARAYIDSLKEE